MQTRTLQPPLPARPATDGDGVRILRSLGPRGLGSLDPFLMLDELVADSADEVGGFPPHPHRGFETVTYLRAGGFRHEDHLGNRGEIGAGGVQWMTAGRGVVHSEMPLPGSGPLQGFQLWLNLPAAEKMRDPGWQDIPAARMPRVPLPGGGEAVVIAGAIRFGDSQWVGPAPRRATQPHYLDLQLPPGGGVSLPVPATLSGFVYVYQGHLVRDETGSTVPAHALSVLGPGDHLSLLAGAEGAGCLLLFGQPLREPVRHHGPFVMNTAEEIDQAVRDYRTGRLTA